MGHFFKWLTKWGILAATATFLVKTLSDNWKDVRGIQLQPDAWMYVGLAIAIAVAAQLCAAMVWGSILELIRHPVSRRWAIVTLLKNAPAKYLPGSVWHLYGRVKAAERQGIGVEFATLSVMLEPLFLIAGALGLALWQHSSMSPLVLGLICILVAVHPRILNRLWKTWRRSRGKEATAGALRRYPLSVLLGALAFMALRSLTFICIVLAFTPLTWSMLQPLMSGFSLAWLLSTVIPAPGGLGVFETSAVNVLNGYLSPGLLLGCVAIYRLVMVSSELIGAGMACLITEGKRDLTHQGSSIARNLYNQGVSVAEN
jgi:glycosyltransferase 2 family protein